MRVLITGIAGFAGSHLAEYILANHDWAVAGTVHRSDRNIRHLADRLELYSAELSEVSETQRVLDAARPEVIFHLAAQALTGRSFEDPWNTLATNIGMQVSVLQSVLNLGLGCRIVVAGSSEEYGLVQEADLPVDEDVPLRPMNPYAVSKIAQDMLALQYHLSHGLDTVRVRPFNHIGPRQRLGFVAPDFARQIALIEAGVQDPVMTVGNLDAERDFTDVRDVVRAYALLAARGEQGHVYNVGSGHSHSVAELLKTLVDLAAVSVSVRFDPARMRRSDVPRVVADCGRLQQATGWEPTYSFRQSLSDTLDYWREQLSVKERGGGCLGH